MISFCDVVTMTIEKSPLMISYKPIRKIFGLFLVCFNKMSYLCPD